MKTKTGSYHNSMPEPGGHCSLLSPDPMKFRVELPVRATFYPLGFPTIVESNSRLAIDAARESWDTFIRRFDTPPLRLRVIVSETKIQELPPDPVFRGQENLMQIVASPENFATCDANTGFAACWLTDAVAAETAWMRFHFLEAMAYMLLTNRYVTPVHAACVALNGCGVLLCGRSGAGKTSLAFACARDGWTFLADDGAVVLRGGNTRTVLGRPHQMRFRETAGRLLPELRDLLASPHPNGKISIEVKTKSLPELATAFECNLGYVVFLNRDAGAAELVKVPADEAFRRLAADLPAYRDDVVEEHYRSLRGMVESGAYELRYSRLEEGVTLLRRLVGSPA
jgi:hypothetical protein